MVSLDLRGTAQKGWAPVFEFAIHSAVGVVLFILVALPAVLLHGVRVSAAWAYAEDPILRVGLAIAEYLLFGVDLVLFAVFVLRAGWLTCIRLWSIEK
jgi:hypothetical protein